MWSEAECGPVAFLLVKKHESKLIERAASFSFMRNVALSSISLFGRSSSEVNLNDLAVSFLRNKEHIALCRF